MQLRTPGYLQQKGKKKSKTRTYNDDEREEKLESKQLEGEEETGRHEKKEKTMTASQQLSAKQAMKP